ncbi:THAP domain-containing protein 6-like [Acanthaster planci]|uniref:THAP domain-containing protein 6-like n=1 Tax=Acanthaster planci TaxID=133434 RepID=A0A8B7XXB0_ACAPL|nr:THAP domain-containing protein 6-like [Acanthaster planci]
MPTPCAAIGCPNRNDRGTRAKGITFHRFPTDKNRQKKWVANLKRGHWEPSPNAQVCSNHFTPQSFDRTGQTVRLREGVEPTILSVSDQPPKQSSIQNLPPVLGTSQEKQNIDPDGIPKVLGRCLRRKNPGDHTYATRETPKQLKQRLNEVVDRLQACKKKLKIEQQRRRRLALRVDRLHSVLDSLRRRQYITVDCAEMLESSVSSMVQLLKEGQGTGPNHNAEGEWDDL